MNEALDIYEFLVALLVVPILLSIFIGFLTTILSCLLIIISGSYTEHTPFEYTYIGSIITLFVTAGFFLLFHLTAKKENKKTFKKIFGNEKYQLKKLIDFEKTVKKEISKKIETFKNNEAHMATSLELLNKKDLDILHHKEMILNFHWKGREKTIQKNLLEHQENNTESVKKENRRRIEIEIF